MRSKACVSKGNLVGKDSQDWRDELNTGGDEVGEPCRAKRLTDVGHFRGALFFFLPTGARRQYLN